MYNYFIQRRSLRERHKNTNYKDDFDYNISEDDEEKKNKKEVQPEGEEPENVATPLLATKEPVIAGGANQLVAYRPNLEVEGEIAIIEKILAMRTKEKDEVFFYCIIFLFLFCTFFKISTI